MHKFYSSEIKSNSCFRSCESTTSWQEIPNLLDCLPLGCTLILRTCFFKVVVLQPLLQEGPVSHPCKTPYLPLDSVFVARTRKLPETRIF